MYSIATATLSLTTPLPLTLHPAAVYLNGLGLGSRATMRQSLNAIANILTNGECDADTLNWAALTYQHTAAVQAILLERHAPVTVKKMMAALRRVLQEARKLKLMDAENYSTAVDLPQIKVNKKLRGRALTQSEIAALIEDCQNDPTVQGIRDMALIAILRGAGLRRAEVVKLGVRDFISETGGLEVRQGKGGKDRMVYLPDSAVVLVENWLAVRGRFKRIETASTLHLIFSILRINTN
ncbi:MAG: tyrosine-type recombinase/integrase [Cyanobacteria bacterium J06592_8]